MAMYQADDKRLMAEYFNHVFIPENCKGWDGQELYAHHFDLPFPLWVALSSKYLGAAQDWKRGRNVPSL